MTAQSIAARCKRKNLPGLMLMLDGEQAYDRVQFSWLRSVMMAMRFPDSFIKLVSLLYVAPTAKMKVNGHLSDSFSLAQGVRQGAASSCPLYLIALQPLLAMIEASDAIRGVEMPGPNGRGLAELHHTSYADDVACFLRGYADLKPLLHIMRTYKTASGAATNWSKTTSGYTPGHVARAS